MNYKQVIARQKGAEARILKAVHNAKNESGIYVLRREDEAGIKEKMRLSTKRRARFNKE